MTTAATGPRAKPDRPAGAPAWVLLSLGAPVLLLVGALYTASPIAAGVVYALFFAALTWARPELALMLVFASTPFQMDISGGGPLKFSIAEINLVILFPVGVLRCLVTGRGARLGPVVLPVLGYLAVCVVASSASWRGSDTIVSMFQMSLYLLIAVSAFATFADRPGSLIVVPYGLVCVGVVFALIGLTTGSFLGMHKNGAGASLSAALVVCVELWFGANRRGRRWLSAALPILAAGLIFTLSRGAWMATIVGVFTIVALRRQFRLLLRMGILLIPFLLVSWFALPEESREYATGFSSTRVNIKARYETIEQARALWNQNIWLGVGVGVRKQLDATNIWYITLAETGILGLTTLILIHIVLLARIRRAERRLDRSSPYLTYLNLAAALILGRLAHGTFDHYWSRGAIMVAWASVGMATHGIAAARAAAAAPVRRSGARRPTVGR